MTDHNEQKKSFLGQVRSVVKKATGDEFGGLREAKSEVAPTTLEGRERRTAQFEGPRPDGRSLRATGRTKQLNLKVTPEFHALLEQLAAEKNSSMIGIVEWAVGFYQDDIRASKGHE